MWAKTKKDKKKGVKNVTVRLLPLLRSAPRGGRILNVTSPLGLDDRFRSEALKEKFRDEDKITEELVDSLAEKYLEVVRLGRVDEEGWTAKSPMYCEFKIFMNPYAITLAKSPQDGDLVLVATFCRGITQTDMLARGISLRFEAPSGFGLKTARDGADTGIWLAFFPKEELALKNGKFFAERKEDVFGWENPGF